MARYPLHFLGLFFWAGLGCSAPREVGRGPVDNPPAASTSEGVVVPGQSSYSFFLDDRPMQPLDPAEVIDGEVWINVAGVLLVLDEPGEYRFAWAGMHNERLVRRLADGKQELVAVRTEWRWDEEDRKHLLNPLAGLTAAEWGTLRGVKLDAWTPGIASQLENVDWQRVCVTVSDDAMPEGLSGLPPLSPELRCLAVEEANSDGPVSLEQLGRWPELRWLKLNLMSVDAFDLGWLDGNPELRALALRGVELKESRGLGKLSRLQRLDLAWVEGLDDIGFVRALKELSVLRITRTLVSDLSPLTGLSKLQSVDADLAPIRILPLAPMPALRTLKMMQGTVIIVDEDRQGVRRKLTTEVQRFRQLNPECRVWYELRESLLHAAVGADRLRVRSGGTCHRQPEKEKTLFTIEGRDSLQEVVEQVDLDTGAGFFQCMCCGDPSFELYRGEQLVVTLGFHHGQSLRWLGGWPGDAALTRESARFLVNWLAEHGVTGPLEESAQNDRQEAARSRLHGCYQKVLAATALTQLGTAESKEAMVALLRGGDQVSKVRAAELLAAFGCNSCDWLELGGMDDLLTKELLPEVPPGWLLEAATGKPTDEVGGLARQGTLRWLLGEEGYRQLKPKQQQLLVQKAAAKLLADPHRTNRVRTLNALGAIGGKDARKLLRGVLASEIQLGAQRGEDTGCSSEFVVVKPTDVIEASDAAVAARALAEMRDRKSLPRIRQLAKEADGESAELLQKAIDKLE